MLGFVFDLALILLRDSRKRTERSAKAAEDEAHRKSLERQKQSIRDQYTAWAKERGLTAPESPDLFHGTINGRAIDVDTGLAGPREVRPIIDVIMRLDVDTPILVSRTTAPSSPLDSAARTVLDRVELLQKIWLSGEHVRLVFERRVHPDVFDAALAAVEEALRADPYR